MVRVEAYDSNNAPLSGITYEVYVRVTGKLGIQVRLLDTLPATDANGVAESVAFGIDVSNVIGFFAREVGTNEEHPFTPIGGDITTVIIGGGRGGRLGNDVLPMEVWEYSYSTGDWKDQLGSIAVYGVDTNGYLEPNPTVTTFAYDDSGNPTGYGDKTLTWEGKRPASIVDGTETTEFAYDENGLRTSKTVGSVTTNYYYNGSVLIGMEQGNDVLRFSYSSGGSVITVNHNGTDYYYLRNGQGDVVALMNASSTKVVEYEYDTWGKPTATTGSLAATLGELNPFRYRGYVWDSETHLYYCMSRYYDPAIGRFVSADALLSTGQGVLGYNMYAYCLNNPINMCDSAGAVPGWNDADGDGVPDSVGTVKSIGGRELVLYATVEDAAIIAGIRAATHTNDTGKEMAVYTI